MYYPYRESVLQEPVRTEIILPAFDYDVVWLGVSDRLNIWEINNTTEFSLLLPIDPPNATFVLAVAWDEDGTPYRYKCWDGGVLHYPIYDGERIGIGARLEVWSVDLDHATLDEDYTLYSSWLTEPELCLVLGGTTVPQTIEASDSLTPGPEPEPIVDTADIAIQGYTELRTLVGYVDNQIEYLEFGNVLGDALGGTFIFDASSSALDDGVDYIKPNNLISIQPGRWVRDNNP